MNKEVQYIHRNTYSNKDRQVTNGHNTRRNTEVCTGLLWMFWVGFLSYLSPGHNINSALFIGNHLQYPSLLFTMDGAVSAD